MKACLPDPFADKTNGEHNPLHERQRGERWRPEPDHDDEDEPDFRVKVRYHRWFYTVEIRKRVLWIRQGLDETVIPLRSILGVTRRGWELTVKTRGYGVIKIQTWPWQVDAARRLAEGIEAAL